MQMKAHIVINRGVQIGLGALAEAVGFFSHYGL